MNAIVSRNRAERVATGVRGGHRLGAIAAFGFVAGERFRCRQSLVAGDVKERVGGLDPGLGRGQVLQSSIPAAGVGGRGRRPGSAAWRPGSGLAVKHSGPPGGERPG